MTFADFDKGRILGKDITGMSRQELTAHMEPARYIGRCPEQVTDFLRESVAPVLERYQDALSGGHVQLKV